jgi:hypothetical protein
MSNAFALPRIADRNFSSLWLASSCPNPFLSPLPTLPPIVLFHSAHPCAQTVATLAENFGEKLARWMPEYARIVAVGAWKVTGGERDSNPFNLTDFVQLDPKSFVPLDAFMTPDHTIEWDVPDGDYAQDNFLLDSAGVKRRSPYLLSSDDWRIQLDYSRTVSDLFCDRFLKVLKDQANSAGLKLRVQPHGLQIDIMRTAEFMDTIEAEQLQRIFKNSGSPLEKIQALLLP